MAPPAHRLSKHGWAPMEWGETAGRIWFPMNAMITNVKDLGSYRLPSEKPSRLGGKGNVFRAW